MVMSISYRTYNSHNMKYHVKDVFGRVTKSILENLVEMSPEIEQQIQMGMSVRATCGFDG